LVETKTKKTIDDVTNNEIRMTNKMNNETKQGHSIFDEPIDLINYSYASRSVPSSRRNSTEDPFSKMSLNDTR
jgi:hypothetical protein